jgi:hypothetical protein
VNTTEEPANHFALPLPSYAHIARMCDGTAMFEHAWNHVPRWDHGYHVDDVSRALLVMSRARIDTCAEDVSRFEATVDSVTTMALAMLRISTLQGCPVRTRMDHQRNWINEGPCGDTDARVLWALAVAATEHPTPWAREAAAALFTRTAPTFIAPFPRSVAIAAIGATKLTQHGANKPATISISTQNARISAHLLLDTLTPRLARPNCAVRDIRSSPWPWMEARLTYANATLCEALIATGHARRDNQLLDEGIALLDWLIAIEQSSHGFSFAPATVGRGPGERGPSFDQQPIEAAAMAEACWRAYRVTGYERYATYVLQLAEWFLGRNDSGSVLYDAQTGGGADGLLEFGVNPNRGAESTLAALMTLQRAHELLALHSAVSGQDRIVSGQDCTVSDQERTVSDQERTVSDQERIVSDQERELRTNTGTAGGSAGSAQCEAIEHSTGTEQDSSAGSAQCEAIEQSPLIDDCCANIAIGGSVGKVNPFIVESMNTLHEHNIVHVTNAFPAQFRLHDRISQHCTNTTARFIEQRHVERVMPVGSALMVEQPQTSLASYRWSACAHTEAPAARADDRVRLDVGEMILPIRVAGVPHFVERIKHGDLHVGMDAMHKGNTSVCGVKHNGIFVRDVGRSDRGGRRKIHPQPAVVVDQPVRANLPRLSQRRIVKLCIRHHKMCGLRNWINNALHPRVLDREETTFIASQHHVIEVVRKSIHRRKQQHVTDVVKKSRPGVFVGHVPITNPAGKKLKQAVVVQQTGIEYRRIPRSITRSNQRLRAHSMDNCINVGLDELSLKGRAGEAKHTDQFSLRFRRRAGMVLTRFSTSEAHSKESFQPAVTERSEQLVVLQVRTQPTTRKSRFTFELIAISLANSLCPPLLRRFRLQTSVRFQYSMRRASFTFRLGPVL